MTHSDQRKVMPHRDTRCMWCGTLVLDFEDYCSAECEDSYDSAMRDRAIDTQIEEMRERERE